MSYGNDQTRINQLRRWLFILFVLLAVALAVVGFLYLRNRSLKNAPEAAAFNDAVDTAVIEGLPVTSTVAPTQTVTDLPTFTPEPTSVPSETPVPATQNPTQTATAKPGATPEFLYGVDEIMYLQSSINLGRYWNPSQSTADVPLDEKVAIEDLLWNQHLQREKILAEKEIKELDKYNAGTGQKQIENYYTGMLDIPETCKWDISIVDKQFNTVIIFYDGEYARTMTMKVEDRDYICDGSVRAEVTADGYAYENELQKIDGVWKIILHPAELGE